MLHSVNGRADGCDTEPQKASDFNAGWCFLAGREGADLARRTGSRDRPMGLVGVCWGPESKTVGVLTQVCAWVLGLAQHGICKRCAWRAGFARYGRFPARVFPGLGLRAASDAEHLSSRRWACSQVSTPSIQ